MSCVRPGVFEVLAKLFLIVNALSAVDFPAFERPAKAISIPVSSGMERILGGARKKNAFYDNSV